MTIGKKLLAWGVIASSLPLIIATAIALWQGKSAETVGTKETTRLASEDQRHIVDGVVAMVTTQQELLELKLQKDLNVARDLLKAAGGLQLTEAKTKWTARNQFDNTMIEIELPQAVIGDQRISQKSDTNSPVLIVDKVKALVGAACTVFQRMNFEGDMVRIITNLQAADGSRAVGTYIPAFSANRTPNPVVRAILKGERYTGRAFVVDKWFVAVYEPIKNAAGEVTGMLFTGIPEQSAESLRAELMRTKVGKQGFVYVIDPAGKYVCSQNGARDGESIIDSKDANGEPFVRQIVTNALRLKKGEQAIARYPWKNGNKETPKQKTVAYAYFAPWNWIIAAETYEEDFQEGVLAIQKANRRGTMLLLTAFVVAILSAIALWSLISRSIASTLRGIADTLRSGAAQTRSAAEKLAELSQSLAEGSSEQAASLEETSASLEEMSSMTRKNVESAGKLRQVGREAREAGDLSQSEVLAMNSAMSAISESTGEVTNIVKTIDEIAFQTNILALNAAVESARAGEAGLGFSVVANEVRNLAQRCALAAKETTQKINIAVQNSADGAKISKKVADSLAEIVARSRTVDDLSSAVATACQEQSRGISQVNTAVTEIDKVTQRTAATAEGSASAAQELEAQATKLNAAVADLISLIDGPEKAKAVVTTQIQDSPAPLQTIRASNRLLDVSVPHVN